MYPLIDDGELLRDEFAKAITSLEKLLSRVTCRQEEVLISVTNNLFSDADHGGFLFLITEGNLSWSRGDEISFVLEPGDLIGIEEFLGTPLGVYQGDFAVRCKKIPAETFLKEVHSTPELSHLWNEYLAIRGVALAATLMNVLQGETKFEPSITPYLAGDKIIEQGSAGRDVYTLISGHADVSVDGVAVGEILPDEIFGALAALTSLPRTATVTARTDSIVLSVPAEKFRELIQRRPHMVQKLVEDMSRTIVDLNSKIVRLATGAPTRALFH